MFILLYTIYKEEEKELQKWSTKTRIETLHHPLLVLSLPSTVAKVVYENKD